VQARPGYAGGLSKPVVPAGMMPTAPTGNDAAGPSDPDCPETDGTVPMYVPDNSSCTKYTVCSGPFGMKMECAPGMHFNRKTNTCDFPPRAKCPLLNPDETATVSFTDLKGPPGVDPTAYPNVGLSGLPKFGNPDPGIGQLSDLTFVEEQASKSGPSTYMPPEADGAATYLPPDTNGAATYIPPDTHGAATYMPPDTNEANTYIPPDTQGDATYMTPGAEGAGTYQPPAAEGAGTYSYGTDAGVTASGGGITSSEVQGVQSEETTAAEATAVEGEQPTPVETEGFSDGTDAPLGSEETSAAPTEGGAPEVEATTEKANIVKKSASLRKNKFTVVNFNAMMR